MSYSTLEKGLEVFIDLILSITVELLILVETYLMKGQDSGMSVYHVVQRLKAHNAVHVVQKLESHYFRLRKVQLESYLEL